MTEKFEDRIKVEYVRELRQNYLVLAADQIQEQGYETRMLMGNAIEGLLKFRIKKTDNCSRFCYEITSRQPLSRLLETRTINAVQIRSFLLGIAQTLTRMEDYLLSEEQILLNPDYIYMDPEAYVPFLCLVPGKHGNFPEEFSLLLQYLLGKADHQDKEGVVLVYGLYKESLKENYGLDNLLTWLMKEECPKVDSPGNQENCETIDLQKTESWEQPLQNDESETDIPLRRAWYWYFMPGAVLFGSAAASAVLFGVYGWITYGMWLALAGALLLTAGAGVYIWSERKGFCRQSSHEEPSRETSYTQKSDIRYSRNQTSYSSVSPYQTNHTSPANVSFSQRTHDKKEHQEISETPGQWQMIFDEEKEPKPVQNPVQSEEQEMNTVLLWNQDEVKECRSLTGEDGSTIPLSYYPFIIGKQEGLCDYVILKNTISRLHLRIDETADGYQITDLNSTNGTYVNGRCLDANETVAIQPGDEIEIADLKFRLK